MQRFSRSQPPTRNAETRGSRGERQRQRRTAHGYPLNPLVTNHAQLPMPPIRVVVGRQNGYSPMELTPHQQNGLDSISEQAHQVARLDRDAEEIRREGAPNQRIRLESIQLQRDAIARNIIRDAEQHHIHSSVAHYLSDVTRHRRIDAPVTLRQHGGRLIAFNRDTGLQITPYEEAHVAGPLPTVHRSNVVDFRTQTPPNYNPRHARASGVVAPPEEVYSL